MTDGTDESCATISKSPTNVTYTLKMEEFCYIDSIELLDILSTKGSVMETAIFTGQRADGTWIELGTMADLNAGQINGNKRTNVLNLDVQTPVKAIRMQVKSTDSVTDRYYVIELSAKCRACTEVTTQTTYTEEADIIEFVTKFEGALPKKGYLILALYKDDRMCGILQNEYAGEAQIKSSISKRDFDTVKVMLLNAADEMRLLTQEEILQK